MMLVNIIVGKRSKEIPASLFFILLIDMPYPGPGNGI